MKKYLIKNPTIVDGTGKESYISDVLIENGIIKKIDKNINDSSAEIIEAKGKYLTPGFIDIHRHCDAHPLYKSDFYESIIKQGITTVVVGNCGISFAPISDISIRSDKQKIDAPVLGNYYSDSPMTFIEYMNYLDNSKLPINYLAMPGLGTVQVAVNGYSKEITEEKIIEANRIISDSLDSGAPGVSLGLMYLPENYRSFREIVKLLTPLKGTDKVLTTHIRGEGDSLVKSIEEVINIAKLLDCKLEISHFKSCGKNNWNNEIFKAIKLIDDARKEGLDIGCDVYPYNAGSTSLNTMIPPSYINGDMDEALSQMSTKVGLEKLENSLNAEYEGWDNFAISLGWDRIIVSGVSKPENKKYVGLSIQDASKKFNFNSPVELVANLLVTENGSVTIINQSMLDSDVEEVIKLPYTTFISDSIYAETDFPHPRLNGAFPRFINQYVHNKKLLSIEEAINKMTLKPATIMNIKDRGVISEGKVADLNMFSLDKFKDNATFKKPNEYASGLDISMVNGIIILEHDEVKSSCAGKLLRV